MGQILNKTYQSKPRNMRFQHELDEAWTFIGSSIYLSRSIPSSDICLKIQVQLWLTYAPKSSNKLGESYGVEWEIAKIRSKLCQAYDEIPPC
jgi:hypothetical protein